MRGAFLTAPLERPVYIKAPEGHARPGYVCRLRKACYGLCDAPRAYFKDFAKYMRTLNVIPTASDVCLYKSRNPAYPSVWVLQYVDDLQVSGEPAEVDAFIKDLTTKYEIRDYKEPQSFIGMELTRKGNKMTLTQTKYIEQMAARFGLLDAHYVNTPMDPNSHLTSTDQSDTRPDPTLYRAMVGSLMYAQVLTQPGLSFAVMQLSRHLARPTHAHINAAKRAIVWAYHHRHLGLTFDGDRPPEP